MNENATRVGIQLSPQHATYAQIRDAAAQLEEIGVDIIFNWDHFFPLTGEPDGLHFEAYTMLAALAEQTSRVEIGPLVTCNSYRNADLLADMARTIDHISDGRFILGIGAGWFERDYDEYGYEFGTPGTRLAALAESLPRIESRLAAVNPAPVRDIPILIGGGGERKTLRLVAQHADIWHAFGKPDVLEHKLEVLRGHCDAVGRDITEIEVSNGVGIRSEDRSFDAELLDELHGLGTRLFTYSISGDDTPDGFDLAPVRQLLDWRDAKNA